MSLLIARGLPTPQRLTEKLVNEKICQPSMLAKIFSRVGVAPQAHGVNLSQGPLVQIDRTHERGVHAHGTVRRRAVQTQKDPCDEVV